MTQTQLLVRKILESATSYKWSLQGFGMLRLYLSPELRLHIWDSNFKVPNVSTIHDHPWSFVSEVVVGEIRDRRYQLIPYGYHSHKFVSIKCGPGGCQLSEPQPIRLHGPSVIVIKAGESYRHTATDIHDTDATDGTVTLVNRVFDRADRDTANVYWRDGEWVSAEPRDATDNEVREISQRSLLGWFHA